MGKEGPTCFLTSSDDQTNRRRGKRREKQGKCPIICQNSDKKCRKSGLLWHTLTVIALLMVLFIHQVAIIYVAVVLVGFGAAGGALQTGLSVVQLFNPGPKGRNTGIYYTFMGIASYLVPVLASRLTIVSGEAAAVYTLMLLMVAFGVLEILSALFLVGQHKKIFGTNPLA